MAREKINRCSQELEDKALQLIADGAKYLEVAKALNLGNTYELERYRRLFPEFQGEAELAEQSYARDLEQKLEEIPLVHNPDVARILCANIQKRLEYMNPKRYSPRHQVDVTHHLDIAGALEQAKNRVLIDVTPHMAQIPQAVKSNKDD